jgi:pSer/pThr/pTyr-binding forkhead associated (FHA) protein
LRFVAELLSEAPVSFAGPALIFRARDNTVRTAPIGASLRFGRSQDNDISFPDLREVSRHHFTIFAHENEFVLTDADSANGTFVRGNPARIQTHHLRDGDVLEAAGILFAFIRS